MLLMKRTKTEFIVLKAFNGDCILVKTFTSEQEEFIVLVDGGTASTFDRYLKHELKEIKKIDLLVLTHIDSDHIGGLLRLFNNSLINELDIVEIWINYPNLINVNLSGQIGFDQANKLKDLILQKKGNVVFKEITTAERFINRSGVSFTILSPTQKILDLLYERWDFGKNEPEVDIDIASDFNTYTVSLEELSKLPFKPDKTVEQDLVNASSISFIISCPDINILLLGDSRSEIIEQELKKLGYNEESPFVCDYVKVSHHGSKNNTSEYLLKLLKTTNYIISTNGGSSKTKHPSRAVIGKIIFNPRRELNELLFIFVNYPISEIKNRIGNFIAEDDMESGNWKIEHKNKF